MRCRYERTFFQSKDGYCVFLFRTNDPSVPQAARKPSRTSGDSIHFVAVGFNLPDTNTVEVDLDGSWVESKYGSQLAVEQCETVVPTDERGLVAYLSSGLIKGVGPETAKAIVKRFGSRTMEVFDHSPEELLQIRGISKKKMDKIVASYQKSKGLKDLVAYLSPYGVSVNKAAKIKEHFGDDSLDIIKTDPFQLFKVKGFGFLTVDAIARQTKVSLNHPLRYAGALAYVLDEARVSGHLFLPTDSAVEKCYELLNRDCASEVVTEQDIRDAIKRGCSEGTLYLEGTRLYLAYERKCEVEVAKRVVSMLRDANFVPISNLPDRISKAEKSLGYTLADGQRKAVAKCLSNPCSILTGGPGTGKTSTLRAILEVYKAAKPNYEILLAAPTGRASRRMTEQTGVAAYTLHSALGIITDEESPMNDQELLSSDLIIVDEFSMVDMRLAYALFSRLKPGAQIIMVGDPDQLPSVGAGNVLRELIRSDLIPISKLEIVFRQASNSRIALNAHLINTNETNLLYGSDFVLYPADTGEQAAKMVLKLYVEEANKHGIEGVQVLSPFRKKGVVSADSLNTVIHDLVNPKSNYVDEVKCGARVFRVGDRIIQTCNRPEVSNGDVGVITGIEREDDEAYINVRMLDGREVRYTQEGMDDVEFSYCMTIHKSQGAEYPVIILPLLKEQYIMLRRNLIYTAVTRAKQKVILIGQKQALFTAVHKCDVDKRNTVLADRVVAYYEREKVKKVS